MTTAIIAHRGASDEAPENTLAAARLAWRQGAHAVETDIRRTCDGAIVCLHDDNTRRTTGVDGCVAELPLARIAALDAGRWKGEAWLGEGIPTWEAMFALTPDTGRLVTEIKAGPETVEPLARAFEASGRHAERLAIIAFAPEVCRAARRRLPGHDVLLLAGGGEGPEGWSRPLDALIDFAHAEGLAGLDLAVGVAGLGAAAIARIHAAGLAAWFWTADAPELIARLARWGADAITTNRPARALERLG